MRPIPALFLALSLSAPFLRAEPAPEDTEVWEPVPAKVDPGGPDAPPSDAIVLFGGGSLDAWVGEDGKPAAWTVADGVLTVKPGTGSIVTREGFGDVQLHLEWRVPEGVEGEGQDRGNSGVYLQGRYEVQILESHRNETYPNGQAAAVYKQHIPEVNASRPQGAWQVYDILFTAPRFREDGSLRSPAYFTVLHNGVLVQHHVELRGPTVWIGEPRYEAHPLEQPISLQDHGHPVEFRNIWVRPLQGPAAE